MRPTIRFSHWSINTYGLLVLAAALAFVLLALAAADGRRIGRDVMMKALPWAIWGGVVGAHLYYLLAGTGQPWSSMTAPQVLNVFRGSAIQGGIAGGIVGVMWFCARQRVQPYALLDTLAPAGAVAQSISRVGCFFAGCCYGKRTTLPVGVVFRDPASQAPLGVALHPTQLYESALMLALAAWLWRKQKSPLRPSGEVFLCYLAGYGLIRFLLQFLRDDDAGRLIAGLSHSQYAALAMLAFAVALEARRRRPAS